MNRSAICLLSGGLDSATVLAIAKRMHGYEPVCLSFSYGQRHSVELDAAARIAAHYECEHHVQRLDFSAFAARSALLGGEVPHGRSEDEMGDGIAPTYVPARNTILLSYALGWAELVDARDVFIGVNALDYSGYPDCRPEYIAAYQKMARLAGSWVDDESGSLFKIHAPLQDKTKADIIRVGAKLDVPYELTHSCYTPTMDGAACGACDSCILRAKGFREAQIPDPTRYAGEAPQAAGVQ